MAGDINKDAVTDGSDLELLVSDWLATTVDPNDANDINNDGKVNFKDYAILAQTWYKIQGHPNIRPMVSGDPNSGYVNVGIANYGPGTWRTFLLVDGRYIGELYWFKSNEPIPLDVSAIGNGTHQLKVVAVRVDGDITVSDVSDNVFNSPLQYCISEEAYDFNEPHHFCAYYSGPNDIAIKVYNEANDLVWSQTYSPQNLHGTIPANVTSSDDLYSVVFAETLSGGESIEKPLAVKFDATKVPPNIEALIIAGDDKIRKKNSAIIKKVRAAFDTCLGVGHYAYLVGSGASYTNLKWYADSRNIKYIYYCGHGGYRPGENPDVLRTTIRLSDGNAVSVKYADPGRPVWCESDGLGPNVHSICQLGFEPGQLKFIHLDCCASGRLTLDSNRLYEGEGGWQALAVSGHSDMSWAFKIPSGGAQVLQGWWKSDVPKGGAFNLFDDFTSNEWTRLKEGDDLEAALTYANSNTGWQVDGPHDNLRLRGAGPLSYVKIGE